MDYMELAEELLSLRLKTLQIPAVQKLSELEQGEYFVLHYLLIHAEAVHPRDLSTALAVSTARIAAILKQLEKKKHIRRYIDDTDKRQVIVVLTEAGRERIEKKHTDVLPYLRSLLEQLEPEDAQSYVRIEREIWNRYIAQA